MRNGKTVECEECKAAFYINPSRFKNKHHTCSKLCLGKLSSKLHSNKFKVPCTVCSKEISYKESHFKKIAYHTCSRACSAMAKSERNKGKNNPNSLNLNSLERYFWNKASDLKVRSASKKLEFNLDYEYLLSLYNDQAGLCHYTSLEMKLHSDKNNKGADFDVLSVDKIVPEAGYTKGNVVLCINSINMMKGNHSLEQIETVFNAIYNKRKNSYAA